MEKIENPFIVSGYRSPLYFCNREAETEKLLTYIRSGASTTLISLRRMGKTGLIKHVLQQLPAGYKGIYLDILGTEDINQLFDRLTTAIIRDIPRKSSFGKKVWDLIQRLRPVIQFEPLSGLPQATFNISPVDAKPGVESLLQMLDEQDFNTVVAIDEFQQITRYPGNNADAWLRSIIQQLKKVRFIFSGSEQHLMSELFTLPSRPFYHSTSFLRLDRIKKEDYAAFIRKHFKRGGRKVEPEVAHAMLEWTNGVTYYVQLLSNRVYGTGIPEVTPEVWKRQAYLLLKEQETVFFSYRNLLTQIQWQTLRAIASEGRVYSPTAQSFLATHGLGSSATLLRSLEALQRYQLIYHDFDEKANRFYSVYDVLFQRWVENQL